MLKLVPVLFAALAAPALTPDAYASCDPTRVVVIEMRNMAFVPAQVEVCVGQTVRWVNRENPDAPRPIRHTVTADRSLAADPANVQLPPGAAPFHSGLLLPGQTYERTFRVPGVYGYVCQPHESMGHVGRLTVIPAG